MKVVELTTKNPAEALAVLDDLRSGIERGEIVCFCAVGVYPDDGTSMWMANVNKHKTRLQLLGALTNLMLHFWNGDIK